MPVWEDVLVLREPGGEDVRVAMAPPYLVFTPVTRTTGVRVAPAGGALDTAGSARHAAQVTLALALSSALIAAVNWAAVWRHAARVEWWTKLLAVAGLIATALSAGAWSSAADGAGRWLVAALCLALAGDLALLGRTARRFLAGVAAFLLGHLAYVVCFVALGLPSPTWAWAVVVLLFAMLVVTRDVAPATYRLAGAAVAVPVALYSLVIAGMLVVAWQTGDALIAAGAAVFVVSDSMIGLSLGRTGFAGPHGRTHTAVMVSYHVGQALMVAGVLRSIA